jgi:hypothetical protein
MNLKKMTAKRLRIRFLLVFLLVVLIIPDFTYAKSDSKLKIWTGSWATAPQLVEPNNMPPAPGLTNHTLRQIIRASIGGDVIRLRFSNLFGKQPLVMKSVAVAVAKEGSIVEPSSQKPLKFNGKSEVTMSPGTEVSSDPLKYKLIPGSRLAITIAFAETSSEITGHSGSLTTSYIIEGNNVMSSNFAGSAPVDHWYVISELEVQTSSKAGTIAILGNSITDGRGSETNF